MDIALAKGAKVRAVFDGVVRQIVVMPGYNKCILVQHGNYFTFYCKLGSTSVKAGDKVKTGDLLGTVDVINDALYIRVRNEKKWYDYIGDATLADAIMDRLVANANKIELKGESMRQRRKK